MDIHLNLGKKNEVVLTCSEPLPHDPEAIYFDDKIGLLFMFLPEGKGIVEMNCPIHQDCADILLTQSLCHLGIFQGGRMIKASTLPLLHSHSVFEGVQ